MEQTNCPAVGLKKWNKWNEVNLIKKNKKIRKQLTNMKLNKYPCSSLFTYKLTKRNHGGNRLKYISGVRCISGNQIHVLLTVFVLNLQPTLNKHVLRIALTLCTLYLSGDFWTAKRRARVKMTNKSCRKISIDSSQTRFIILPTTLL